MSIVYLAGPITGLSYNTASNWRNDFEKYFGISSIKCLSPLRCKEYLEGNDNISSSSKELNLSTQFAQQLSGDRGIFERDFNDVLRADLLVVNLLGASKVSIGTVMEMAWAKVLQVPLIVIMEPTGNPHDHPFVRECLGFRVDNIEDAVQLTKAILC